MSRYEGLDSYVYPNTGVLRNKANIHDQAGLDAFEADATAVRLLELVGDPLQGNFDLDHLRAIHRHLFQDVYEWAGELRTVDISRGTSRFASFGLIEAYLGSQLKGVAQEDFLRSLAPESFVARLAHYMSEINAAHPFREGNGRVQRAFCAQLADQAGYFMDFQTIDQAAMYDVMIASFNGDEKPLANLLGEITAIVE
jgi:cell filamentation protein